MNAVKTFAVAVILTLAPSLAGSAEVGGAALRRAQGKIISDCKAVNSTTARQFFEVGVATKTLTDRKFVSCRSLDVAFSTNSVRISSFAALSSDASGYPLIGYDQEWTRPLGPNVKLFIRRSNDTYPADPTVCCEAAE